jgi:uncharacterized membrane protein
MKPRKPLSGRLAFLDWSRGLAAVIMLQGHTFHAYASKDLREGGPYVLSQFVGGIVPAIFLFLTGVTMAFLMDSRERQGMSPGGRVMTALRRAGYLFGLALIIRIQLYLFSLPYSHWTDLLKVDVLNCMGLGLALLSVLGAVSTRDRIRYGALAGLAIAAASPLISIADWSAAPEIVRAYLAPDYRYFSLFPWAAFAAFGLAAGSVLRLIDRETLPRVLQWSALIGVILVMASRWAADIPYSVYPKSDFWLDSPWLVLIKLGIIMVILPGAWLWMEYGRKGFSWVAQLGSTSLIVYWLHIELVYGRWFHAYKESLNLAQTVAASILLIALMVGVSLARTHGRDWMAALLANWLPQPKTRPVSGD